MMAGATYLCTIGCTTDCRHGHACMIGGFGGIDADHPHPVERGRPAHIAYDFDANETHEWNGEAGKCRVSTPEDADA